MYILFVKEEIEGIWSVHTFRYTSKSSCLVKSFLIVEFISNLWIESENGNSNLKLWNSYLSSNGVL